jgi:hypothetical protein
MLREGVVPLAVRGVPEEKSEALGAADGRAQAVPERCTAGSRAPRGAYHSDQVRAAK